MILGNATLAHLAAHNSLSRDNIWMFHFLKLASFNNASGCVRFMKGWALSLAEGRTAQRKCRCEFQTDVAVTVTPSVHVVYMANVPAPTFAPLGVLVLR